MKMNKFFMLGLAGLAFAACSNEEEVTSFPDGGGAVTVKLVNPSVLTKTVTDPTVGNDNVTITGDITISLYDGQTASPSQTMTLPSTSITSSTELTFWNVTSPEKITVSINDGINSYTGTSITDLQDNPANIPAYGQTENFKLTGTMGSPDPDNAYNAAQKTGTESGANSGDENKQYQIYTAKVTMAIPVARLEISGIKHKSHPQQATPGTDVCEYTTLTIKGVYMDNLYTQGGEYSEKYNAGTTDFYNSVFGNGTSIQDYCWEAGKNLGTGLTAILKDEITTGENEGENFLASGSEWPKQVATSADDPTMKDQAFAYNFYPAAGDNMPKFKIYFDTSVSSDPTNNPKPAPRFAMITKYKKDGQELTAFEPGKIYRITNAELVDGNIIGDEGGNTLYGVEVTVKEAEWSVVDITADWAGSN